MCRDHDGKVTPEEVAAAAAYLKDTIGKEGVQELISNLAKDKGPCTSWHLHSVRSSCIALLFLTVNLFFLYLYAHRRKDPRGRYCEASIGNRGTQRGGRGSPAVAGSNLRI